MTHPHVMEIVDCHKRNLAKRFSYCAQTTYLQINTLFSWSKNVTNPWFFFFILEKLNNKCGKTASFGIPWAVVCECVMLWGYIQRLHWIMQILNTIQCTLHQIATFKTMIHNITAKIILFFLTSTSLFKSVSLPVGNKPRIMKAYHVCTKLLLQAYSFQLDPLPYSQFQKPLIFKLTLKLG